jgi:outer membrane immunogenic protein
MKYCSPVLLAFFTLASVNASRAADMPVKAPTPPPAPAYSWTGFYIGGDVGGAWTTDPATWTPLPLGPFPPITNFGINAISAGDGGSSFLGALHAGYNWQFAPTWAIGLEGDWSWKSGRVIHATMDGFWHGCRCSGRRRNRYELDLGLDGLAACSLRLSDPVQSPRLRYRRCGMGQDRLRCERHQWRWRIHLYSDRSVLQDLNGLRRRGWARMGDDEPLAAPRRVPFYQFGSQSALVSNVNFPGKPSNFAWGTTSVNLVRIGLSYKF